MWARKLWEWAWRIIERVTVVGLLLNIVGDIFGYVAGLFVYVWPESGQRMLTILNERILTPYPQSVVLAAETLEAIAGITVDRASLTDMANRPPTRELTVAIGDTFLPLVSQIFDVNAAAQDFSTRTGFVGSVGNLSAYFGTNLTFQLRSLVIGSMASITGWGSLRHLEGLHQTINWAFGFGWLSWTVMSTYMEVTVLPGLRRQLNGQVLPNDYTESEVYSAFLAGMEERGVFDQVLNNLGLRFDVRDNLLDLREADLSEANMRDLLEDGELEDTDINRMMRLRGFREERAQWKTNLIVEQRIRSINQDLLTSLGRQFRDCAIPEANLRAAMSANGWTALEEDLGVAYWENERRNRRFLSLAQSRDAIAQGILTQAEWEADLACQGYTTRDISILTQLTEEADVERPRISAFSLSPSILTGGGQVEVTWRVDLRGQPGSVVIEPLLGSVQPEGSQIVDITQNTTFTIIARNDDGETRRLESIIVRPPRPERPPTVSLSVSPSRFDITDVPVFVEVRWTTNRADTVTISPILGPVPPEGSRVVPVLITTTFAIEATGPGGTTRQERSVIATAPSGDETGEDAGLPSISLSVRPGTIDVGDELEIRWSSNNADRVEILPTLGLVALTGSRIVQLTENTTLRAIATNDAGETIAERSVIVLPPPESGTRATGSIPRVALSIRPGTINRGEPVEIEWISRDADTIDITPTLGRVGKQGSRIVFPRTTTTYKAQATGPGGNAEDDNSVIVLAPTLPTITPGSAIPTTILNVRPGTIVAGDEVEIRWHTEGAQSVRIQPAIGTVGPVGSVLLRPLASTTYTLTAVNNEGTATAEASLIVKPVTIPDDAAPPSPPRGMLSVTPSRISEATDVEVKWSINNAETIEINNGIGQVDKTGVRIVRVTETVIFRLVARGPGGELVREDAVVLEDLSSGPSSGASNAPTGTFSISPRTVSTGELVDFRWSIRNAEKVTILPDLGSVPPTGSRVLSVSHTTVYQLTATSPDGQLVLEDAVIVRSEDE